MNDCPNCEYHRKRAQRWRAEAYKQAGHPLPEQDGECTHCADGCPACDARKLPEQEPVAWFSTLPDGRLSIKIVGKPTEGNWEPLYTTPPQRTWVGLTYEDMVKLQKDLYDAKGESVLPTTFAMAVEAKLKEKNT